MLHTSHQSSIITCRGVDQGASGASMDAPGVGLSMVLDSKWSGQLAKLVGQKGENKESKSQKRQNLILGPENFSLISGSPL